MWKRPKSRLGFMTAALMLIAAAPLTAHAKGPQPSADFIVEAEIWPRFAWDPDTQVGTFSASGIVEDAGDVYYEGDILQPDGSIWEVYEFVGDFGAFVSALPARPLPDANVSYAIEILGSGGAYVDLNAAGTAKGHAHTQCHWVRDDPIYRGRECITWVDWTLDAYVP